MSIRQQIVFGFGTVIDLVALMGGRAEGLTGEVNKFINLVQAA